jgi:hypothetical protein
MFKVMAFLDRSFGGCFRTVEFVAKEGESNV